jgi:MFS family permease
MPAFGRLGDQISKKKIYLLGIMIFFSGTLIIGLSPNYTWALVGFFLQGVGIASLTLGVAVIAQIFPWQQRGIALTAWQLTIPVGHMVGSFVGGFVINQFGWQFNFFGLSFCSFCAIFIVRYLLPQLDYGTERPPLDWIGAVSLTTFVATFLLLATTGSQIQLGMPLLILFLALSILSLVVLVTNPFKVPVPFISLEFLTNRRFIIPSVAANLRNIGLSSFAFILPLYLARVLELSPQHIGIFLLIHSMILAIGTALGGYLADRLPSRIPGLTGLILQAVGLVWFSSANADESILFLLPGIVLFDMGAGSSLIAFMKEAQSSLGPEKVGIAAGLFSTLRLVGAAAAVPIIGLLLEFYIETGNGLIASATPYQYVFRILACVVFLGALLAAFIPAKESKVARTHS